MKLIGKDKYTDSTEYCITIMVSTSLNSRILRKK